MCFETHVNAGLKEVKGKKFATKGDHVKQTAQEKRLDLMNIGLRTEARMYKGILRSHRGQIWNMVALAKGAAVLRQVHLSKGTHWPTAGPA